MARYTVVVSLDPEDAPALEVLLTEHEFCFSRTGEGTALVSIDTDEPDDLSYLSELLNEYELFTNE